MSGNLRTEWTSWFRKELRELPPDQQARVVRRVRTFEEKGWNASAADQDIKKLEGEIWELRVHGKGPAYRILFFPDPANPQRIVVLATCVKKSLMKKLNVSRAEIGRADSRRLEWLDKRKKES